MNVLKVMNCEKRQLRGFYSFVKEPGRNLGSAIERSPRAMFHFYSVFSLAILYQMLSSPQVVNSSLECILIPCEQRARANLYIGGEEFQL